MGGCSVAAEVPRREDGRYENKQLVHRHPLGFVRRVLDDFNAGSLDAATAASHLGVSRSRLHELRTAWPSGGGRRKDWPPEARRFLLEFLPLQNPPNYPLVAVELKRLYAHLVPSPARPPRVYRRFRRARIGEL